MSPAATVEALSTLISLLGLWVLFFWLYRDYRVDTFRQQLFSLRDQLFDYAVSRQIAFDHPAYGFHRRNINGMIRFAHRLTLTWLFTVLLIRRLRPAPEFEQAFHAEREQAIRSAPVHAQAKLRGFWDRSLILAAEHLMLCSPVFWILIIPVLLVVLIHVAWQRGADLLRSFPGLDLIDQEARQAGALT